LLHWLRIGAFAGLRGERLELESLAAAMRNLRYSSWMTDREADYPAHGIRRFGAIIAAAMGNRNDALSILGLLRLPMDPMREPAMALTVAAAHLQVASLLWQSDRDAARQLLAGTPGGRPGARQIVDSFLKAVPVEIPTLHRELESWQDLLSRDGDDMPVRLARAALIVPD
jgi:hypothetical protein